MEPISLYKMNRTPSSSSTDIAKSLRVSTAFDYFQDIAGLHADNLGAGIDHLKETFGVAWILMRIRIEFDKYPHLEEPLVVETWPQPPNTLYDRDYIIRGEKDGEVFARSISTWIVMDVNTHDIAKGRLFDYTYDIEITPRAIDKKLRQLKAPGELLTAGEHPVTYSDIDYNLHVNNARYIDIILDTYDLDFHKAYEVAAIEVNYINEIRPDETLVIKKATYPQEETSVDAQATEGADTRTGAGTPEGAGATESAGTRVSSGAPGDTSCASALIEYVELCSSDDGRTAIKALIEFRKRK